MGERERERERERGILPFQSVWNCPAYKCQFRAPNFQNLICVIWTAMIGVVLNNKKDAFYCTFFFFFKLHNPNIIKPLFFCNVIYLLFQLNILYASLIISRTNRFKAFYMIPLKGETRILGEEGTKLNIYIYWWVQFHKNT